VLDIKTPLWLLLAETAEPVKKAAEDAANGAARPSGFESMLPALAVIMVLFWFLILRPQKNKEKQFRSLVENLKETDRVVTIGGIHGVVTNVQRNVDGGIVTLRVDESTGAKIRVGANAIARVITEEDKTE
jgi:preprotein translocase subunit YajC